MVKFKIKNEVKEVLTSVELMPFFACLKEKSKIELLIKVQNIKTKEFKYGKKRKRRRILIGCFFKRGE